MTCGQNFEYVLFFQMSLEKVLLKLNFVTRKSTWELQTGSRPHATVRLKDNLGDSRQSLVESDSELLILSVLRCDIRCTVPGVSILGAQWAQTPTLLKRPIRQLDPQ